MTLRRPSISPEQAACFLLTACAQQAGGCPSRVSVAELPPARPSEARPSLSVRSLRSARGGVPRSESGWPGRASGGSLWVDGATARLRSLGVCAPVSAGCSWMCATRLLQQVCTPCSPPPSTPGVCTATRLGRSLPRSRCLWGLWAELPSLSSRLVRAHLVPVPCFPHRKLTFLGW